MSPAARSAEPSTLLENIAHWDRFVIVEDHVDSEFVVVTAAPTPRCRSSHHSRDRKPNRSVRGRQLPIDIVLLALRWCEFAARQLLRVFYKRIDLEMPKSDCIVCAAGNYMPVAGSEG